MEPWRQNVTVIWISQFLSITAFAFALPFAPFYLQVLGITEPRELKIWVALFAAATPLALAVFAPIWGVVADRYGRRLMMIRAHVGAAIVLGLMATVQTATGLVVLRVLQGVLTGTMTAAQTMVATSAPPERSGLALGTLSAAVFSGGMTGAFLGGVFAHYVGYRAAFVVASGLQVITLILLLVGTRENFERPRLNLSPSIDRLRVRLKQLRLALPVLLLVMMISFVRQFDFAFLPLLVQEIHGRLEGASLWTGGLTAIGGAAGFLAGILIGRWSDRASPSALLKASAIGAGISMFIQGLARRFLVLFPARFGMLFCSGGLDPVVMTMLARSTPEERRGFIFGWAASARSLGWAAAPLVSGLVAAQVGIRYIYVIGGVLFLLLVPAVAMVIKPLVLAKERAMVHK